MNKFGVVVLAYNRPNYLYVTLDSLFRNKSIDKVDVGVYIDGGSDNIHDVLNVVNGFGVNHIHVNDTNLMVLNSLMSALGDLFYNRKYDKVLYIEDDHILRTDTIEYCLSTNIEEFVLCLSGNGGKARDYRPKGNVITKDNFDILNDWIGKRMYVGTARPNHPDQILAEDTKIHDAVFYSFIVQHQLLSQFAPEFYVATFGVRGVHSRKVNIVDHIIERFFSGDRDTWVDNVVEVIMEQKFDNNLNPDLWPGERFEYQ
jgi:hypothetical protein